MKFTSIQQEILWQEWHTTDDHLFADALLPMLLDTKADSRGYICFSAYWAIVVGIIGFVIALFNNNSSLALLSPLQGGLGFCLGGFVGYIGGQLYCRTSHLSWRYCLIPLVPRERPSEFRKLPSMLFYGFFWTACILVLPLQFARNRFNSSNGAHQQQIILTGYYSILVNPISDSLLIIMSFLIGCWLVRYALSGNLLYENRVGSILWYAVGIGGGCTFYLIQLLVQTENGYPWPSTTLTLLMILLFCLGVSITNSFYPHESLSFYRKYFFWWHYNPTPSQVIYALNTAITLETPTAKYWQQLLVEATKYAEEIMPNGSDTSHVDTIILAKVKSLTHEAPTEVVGIDVSNERAD